MKIIVLHGDHYIRAYERLQKFIKAAKSRNWHVGTYSNQDQALSEQLVKRTLFEKNSLHVYENLTKLKPADIKWLNQKSSDVDGTLVIFHKGLASRALINKLPKDITVEGFNLPKNIFRLMNEYYPGNKVAFVKLLKHVQTTEPGEFIFALLAKHIRDLYWAKKDISSMGLPSWRAGKLKTQAYKFEELELKAMISALAEIDVKVKTSAEDMESALDLFVLTNLE